jgi:hypothetical protein
MVLKLLMNNPLITRLITMLFMWSDYLLTLVQEKERKEHYSKHYTSYPVNARIIAHFIIIISLLFISSCGFLRTIGLYNTPPDYADSFKNGLGKEFIKHNNDSKNLLLTLKTTKTKYSPYEEIELILKVNNISLTDTMYLYKPNLRGVVVLDSNNRKKKVLEYETTCCGVIVVDKYGRRINPTVAPDNFKLPPQDSLITKLSFRTGNRLCPLVTCFFSFVRENAPGDYKIYFQYSNEEYDRLKGPVLIEIKSEEINYTVRDYTKDELNIRQDVESIISALKNNSDSSNVYSLFSSFETNYPDNVYISQLSESLKTHYYLEAKKNK